MTTDTTQPRTGEARRDRILQLLAKRDLVTVAELSELFAVSAVTVRSDLEALEAAHLLRRVRGGATAMRPARFERPLDLPSQLFTAEKERIGARAAGLVRDGETIIIDSGSTALALAHALSPDLKDVVVVTNCLDVALTCHPHDGIDVIVTGGRLKPPHAKDRYHSLLPPLTRLVLDEVHADMAFLCCTGVHARHGFTNRNWDEAELKKSMIGAARRACFLADHGKIGHVGSARIARIADVWALVSDTGAETADVAELESHGLTLYQA